MKGLFITGTGTGIGKTWFTAHLTRQMRELGLPALALKPIACGDRDDATLFASVNGEVLTLNEINPVHFATPAAPYTASLLEERPLEWSRVWETLDALNRRFPGPFFIEGVGGWLVPLDATRSVREWAVELGLPLVVVASAALGTLNHTRLTVESIRTTSLEIRGIVLNHHGVPDDVIARTNGGLLADLCGLPVWETGPDANDRPLPDWLVP